jgi:hypothetical protein
MKYIIIFLFIPFILFAQSELVGNSSFAFEADYAITNNNNFSGKGADIGISLAGKVDFGIEYVNGSYNTDFDMESKGETFFAAYNLKHNKSCIKLMAGYTQDQIKFGSHEFDFSGVLLAIVYYGKIYESESLFINPGLGYSMGFLSMSGGDTVSDYGDIENPRSIHLDFNFIPKLNKNVFLIIAPSISKDLVNHDNSLMVGINIGLLFNASKK